MQDISKKELVKIIDRDRPVILEVGSHNGKDGKELAGMFKKGATLHQFEPDPRFKPGETINNPGGHYIHALALTNCNGDREFNYSKGRNNASGSLKKPTAHLELFPDVTFPGVISVECMTLDRWYTLNLRDWYIDFVWCDINGAEMDFIDGGWFTLEMKTRYLYIEFQDRQLYKGAPNREEIKKALPGFDELGMYNYGGNFGNILLKNKRFA